MVLAGEGADLSETGWGGQYCVTGGRKWRTGWPSRQITSCANFACSASLSSFWLLAPVFLLPLTGASLWRCRSARSSTTPANALPSLVQDPHLYPLTFLHQLVPQFFPLDHERYVLCLCVVETLGARAADPVTSDRQPVSPSSRVGKATLSPTLRSGWRLTSTTVRS